MDVITHTFHKFIAGLAKLALKFGHVWFITPHKIMYGIAFTLRNINQAVLAKEPLG